MRFVPVVILIALALAGPAIAPAQERGRGEEADPLRGEFTEQVRVNLVQLNFIATDKKGRPVTDLKPGEIEIVDGGTKQEIAFLQPYYTPVKPAPEAGPGELPAPGQAEAAAEPPPPPAEPPAGPRRWIVLFLDNYTTTQRTRLEAIEAARKFIVDDLTPGDQVAVVTFAGKFEIIQGFTSEAHLLHSACDRALTYVDRASPDRFNAVEDLTELFERCRTRSDDLSRGACADRLTNSYEDEKVREADAIMTSLTLIVRAIAPIPDVKTLVLFSEGFSRIPRQDAADVATAVLGPRSARRVSVRPSGRVEEHFDRLAEAAAAAKVSIFTINPGGSHRHSAISAARGSPLSDRNNPLQIDVHRRTELNHQQGLVELARRTGGTASTTADVSEGLATAIDVARGLYTVGYYLSAEVDLSRKRSVRIRVKRKGVDVRTRREVPVRPMQPPLLGDLTLTPESCDPRGRRAVHMRVRLDRKRLRFEKLKDDFSSNFSLFIRFVDTEEATPLYQDYHFFNITNSKEQVREGGLPDPVFERTLMAPCRPLTVRVTATDAGSGAEAMFKAEIPG